MRCAFVAAALSVALAIEVPAPAEEGGAEPGRRARIVARVSATRAITVGELEDRIAQMPPFQRATFGDTADAVRRRVLGEVMLPDVLLSIGAEGDRLGERLPTSHALERALSGATLRAIRVRIGPASAISMDDVRAYYEYNRARYDTPERYQIWRILCQTREEAQLVLDATKNEPTPATFARLAREHSQDKATSLRSGNVGFVTADGVSSEPGLRVDPAVVHAAQGVRDGSLVPEPVAEGERFAVVWRRGTIASNKRTVDDVAAQIRDVLWKARLKEETDREIAALRVSNLRGLNERLLDTIDLPVLDAAPRTGPRPP
jgi:peptidyl-prolyl cis-trans isomerase C